MMVTVVFFSSPPAIQFELSRAKSEVRYFSWVLVQSLYPSDEFTKDVFGLQTNSHGLGNP